MKSTHLLVQKLTLASVVRTNKKGFNNSHQLYLKINLYKNHVLIYYCCCKVRTRKIQEETEHVYWYQIGFNNQLKVLKFLSFNSDRRAILRKLQTNLPRSNNFWKLIRKISLFFKKAQKKLDFSRQFQFFPALSGKTQNLFS